MANNISIKELLEGIVKAAAVPKPKVTKADVSGVSDVGGSSASQPASQQHALEGVQLSLNRKRRHPCSQRAAAPASQQGVPSAAGFDGLPDDDSAAADPATVYCPDGIRDAEHVPQGECFMSHTCLMPVALVPRCRSAVKAPQNMRCIKHAPLQ
jgi:hypothetical protein